jgi:hypothetical protein
MGKLSSCHDGSGGKVARGWTAGVCCHVPFDRLRRIAEQAGRTRDPLETPEAATYGEQRAMAAALVRLLFPADAQSDGAPK